ncbi:hypothetical protein KACHI17_18510 [Sediminibacterium sp. KACHI17]|uniref:DUF2892 domain-containing protein n=1 Tax=Sediminibacterium sp. KACHI17 TaxID=1751071 RepID=A0AAT9GJY4_9BACT
MKVLTSNWHMMRIIRLILAMAIVVQSWYMRDSTTAVLGVVLLASAVFNVGCCGAGGCSKSFHPVKKSSEKDPVYEEVV